jgi:2-amino-4-hydroxy-6-hydroxymethyldihydropteridine diphosphokinase
MHRAIVGLGANLGDRLATIRTAASALGASDGVAITRASKLYATAPLGPPQPDFLNAAVLVNTTLEPEALLDVLLSVEANLGRVRHERWGPRTIDLDLLWMDDLRVETPRLVVPHPGLYERPFALGPLVDVLPEAAWAEARLARLGGPPAVFMAEWLP